MRVPLESKGGLRGQSPLTILLSRGMIYLTGRKDIYLMYAGFATNWRILGRDYGMRAMSRRGYNTILLRDSTMGVEWPDTVDNLFATKLAIREVEVQIGFSASDKDFFKTCQEEVS